LIERRVVDLADELLEKFSVRHNTLSEPVARGDRR
jgi:hypothetical protein